MKNRKAGARTGKASKSTRKTLYLGIDLPLFLATVTLVIFGLLMVYSASYDYSLSWYGDASTIFKRQITWLGLGLVGAAVLVWLDYHILQRVAVILMGLTLFSLIAVFFTNEVRNNAVRTLLGGSVQPSELAKLVTVIYLAVWLYARRDQLEDVSIGLFPLAAILGLLGGLIFLQPDLSAVATIVFLGGTMFFLAGGALRQIGLLIVGGLLVGWIVVQLSSTGSNRVAEYIQGVKDPMLASYHVRRALEAFANGGWFGVGIGKAATKVTGLPVPPTDSIFAVVGEETGFVGAGGLILLYLTLLWRGLIISRRAPDGLGALLAAGLSLWIAMEAFVNMAVMVNLLPFAGNALPFISAGGSSLVVSLAAVGILLNISRKSEQSSEENERTFSAVVDLRRRDRRGRLSRSHRSSGYDG